MELEHEVSEGRKKLGDRNEMIALLQKEVKQLQGELAAKAERIAELDASFLFKQKEELHTQACAHRVRAQVAHRARCVSVQGGAHERRVFSRVPRHRGQQPVSAAFC